LSYIIILFIYKHTALIRINYFKGKELLLSVESDVVISAAHDGAMEPPEYGKRYPNGCYDNANCVFNSTYCTDKLSVEVCLTTLTRDTNTLSITNHLADRITNGTGGG